jgi:flagellar motility protein MotE (MotC chaperone)
MSRRQEQGRAQPKRKRGGLKIVLVLFFLMGLGLGVTYALAKFGLVRLPQKPFLNPIYAKLGLNSPQLPARTAAPPPDPLAEERKRLAVQREALAKDREEWESQKQEQAKREAEAQKQAAAKAQETAKKEKDALDPKGLARMAAVYEEMPTAKVSKIFAVLPDNQLLQLLKRMDEKKVAEILAEEKRDKAVKRGCLRKQGRVKVRRAFASSCFSL